MLTLVMLIAIGFCLILGLISRKEAGSKVGKLLLMALLTPIILGIGLQVWRSFSMVAQVLLVLAVVTIGFMILAGMLLGRRVIQLVVAELLADGIRSMIHSTLRVTSALFQKLWQGRAQPPRINPRTTTRYGERPPRPSRW